MNFSIFYLLFLIYLQMINHISMHTYSCQSLCYGVPTCIYECESNRHHHAQIQPSAHSHEHKPHRMPDNDDEDGGQHRNSVTIDEINSKTCGLRRTDAVGKPKLKGALGMGRIVGGVDAEPNEFPWQVSIRLYFPDKNVITPFCGGAIINEYWILTAAHCLDNKQIKPEKLIIRIGSNILNDANLSNFTVNKYIKHEGWHKEKQANDIALIKLNEKIVYKTTNAGQYKINSICLPEEGYEAIGQATVAGFGQLGENAATKVAEYLQKLIVPIFDHHACVENYKEYLDINNLKICAGGKGDEDSCMGDSGGPLLQIKDNRAIIIGVVSFGLPCAKKDMPTVYTKVSKYIPWIREHII